MFEPNSVIPTARTQRLLEDKDYLGDDDEDCVDDASAAAVDGANKSDNSSNDPIENTVVLFESSESDDDKEEDDDDDSKDGDYKPRDNESTSEDSEDEVNTGPPGTRALNSLLSAVDDVFFEEGSDGVVGDPEQVNSPKGSHRLELVPKKSMHTRRIERISTTKFG